MKDTLWGDLGSVGPCTVTAPPVQVLQQNIHFHETLLVSWKLFTHNCTEAKVRPLSYQEESRVKSEQNF